MAPVHSFSWFFTLVCTIFPVLALARPWIVTENFEAVTITADTDEYYYYDDEPTVTTSYQSISPTITAMPAALSTMTSIDDYSSVTVIRKLYPSDVGTPVVDPNDSYYYLDSEDDEQAYSDQLYRTTVYVVPLTLSAPSSCSDQWTTTTDATLYVPTDIAAALPHTAVSTSFSTDNSEAFHAVTYTYEYVSVEPTQVPSASLSMLREDEYLSMYDRGFCSYNTYSDPCSEYGDCYPNTDGYTDSSSSGSGSSDGNDYSDHHTDYEGNGWFFDSYWMGISPFALTMILLFGWIGVWLIAGFIEAWLRFRRLMLGWQTRRGLPVCWAFTVLPLSLFLLFFFKKGYRARSLADAAVLREKWNDMSFGTKLKLFFIWGFRYKYPDVLGSEPPTVKSSKVPRNEDPNAPRNAPASGLLAAAQPPQMTGAGPARGLAPGAGVPGPSRGAATATPGANSPVSPAGSASGSVHADVPASPAAAAAPAQTGHGVPEAAGNHDEEIGRAQ